MSESVGAINMAIRKQLDAVGERLRLLRLSLGYKKATPFAKALGIEGPTYRTYERGENPPPYEVLGRIKELTGASADWVLYGDAGSLTVSLYQMIYGRVPSAE